VTGLSGHAGAGDTFRRPRYQYWLLPFAIGVAIALAAALRLFPQSDVLAAPTGSDRLMARYLVLQGDEVLLRAEVARLAALFAGQRKECRPPEPEPAPAPKIDEALRIPEEAKRSGDVSFLTGCWNTITGLINTRTREPIKIEYCFDDKGIGRSTRTEPTQQCIAPLRASFDAAGNLLIEETAQGVCPDGNYYIPSRVACMPDADGVAACNGSNSRNNWTLKIQRKGPAPPADPASGPAPRPRR